MIDLNNIDEIKKHDPKNCYGSIEMLPLQCKQAWDEGKTIQTPEDYKNVKSIVISGMGGSAYAGRIIPQLFKDLLNVPITIVDDYNLPAFVDESTLIVLTTYSGTTEEVLSTAEQAEKRNAKIVGVTSGGVLANWLKERNLPSYLFTPKYNPSNQPRLAPGYIIIGTIAVLWKIGLLVFPENEMVDSISILNNSSKSIKTTAQEISQKIQGTIPVFFSAEFLKGNAYIMRNQHNETAKSFSAYSELPELNHHLMEGLRNPPDKKLTICFLNSDLYSDSIKKRIDLTKDVVSKNNIKWIEFNAFGSSKISQMLTTLSFGGYLSLYLALLYGIDPSLIPWVDYFKEELLK